MNIRIKEILIYIFIFLGYTYETRRIIYYKGVSALDIIISVYLIVFLLNKLKRKTINLKKQSIILLSLLSIDLAVGIIKGNRIEYIFSDFMIIVLFIFLYVLFRKEEYDTFGFLKLFYIIATLNSVMCIYIYMFPESWIFKIYNEGSKYDITQRVYGPDLVFWIPVLVAAFFKMYRNYKKVFLTFIVVGFPAVFIIRSRELIVMLIIVVGLCFLYKIVTIRNCYKKIFLVYILIFFVISTVYFINNSSDERIRNIFYISKDTALNYREYTNSVVIEEIKNNIPIGGGLGKTYLFQLNSSSEIINYSITDNTFLTIALKTNILTGIVLIILIVKIIYNLRKRPAELIILASLLASGLVSTALIKRTHYVVILVYIFIIMNNCKNDNSLINNFEKEKK